MKFERVPSPLRGQYLVQNAWLNACLKLCDFLLERLVPRRSGAVGSADSVQRILICNGAHLGDVLLSTTVLSAIRARFPAARIGMLVGSWARPVLHDGLSIDWVHTVDHWRLNRAGSSRISKVKQYFVTRARALRDIRSIRYDVAVDLYFFFPNSAFLLWQARIPTRIGYGTAGFASLMTDAEQWALRDCSVVDYHYQLLRRIGVERLPNLASDGTRARGPRGVPLAPPPGFPSDYVVLHLGTGSPLKAWPARHWTTLARALAAQGHTLVFTGAGADERAAIEQVAAAVPGCVNACNVLDWAGFVAALACARVVVSVDSVAAHVAALTGAPVVVVGTGMTNLHWWRPLATDSAVLMNPVPCAPCYSSRGCEGMACIRGLEPAAVFDEVQRLMREENCPTSPADRLAFEALQKQPCQLHTGGSVPG